MALPWGIPDRLVLGTAWPSLHGAVAVGALGWVIGGPTLAVTVGPFALAVGRAGAYGSMARHGEYVALLQSGTAPGRIGAAVVTCALALALVEAAGSTTALNRDRTARADCR